MLLYKYRAFEQLEFVLDILLKERLFCSEYRYLNDPFEGAFYAPLPRPVHFSVNSQIGAPLVRYHEPKTIEDLIVAASATRVCSLSASPRDVRLWSLYASGHTGVAIEIDVNGLESKFKAVEYVEKLPIFGNTILTCPSTTEILTYKTRHWRYEEEYRIIGDDQWYEIGGRIRRILIGHRASEDRIELLKKVVDGRVPVIRTVLDYESMEVRG